MNIVLTLLGVWITYTFLSWIILGVIFSPFMIHEKIYGKDEMWEGIRDLTPAQRKKEVAAYEAYLNKSKS